MKRIFLILTFICSSIYSQEKTNFVHHLGAWLGASSGMGLSYRFKPTDWSIQFQFLPYYYEGDIFISGGICFQKYLVETENTSLLLYIGLGTIYSRYDIGYYNYESNSYLTDRIMETGIIQLGSGPGFELKIGRIVLCLNLGYAIYYFYLPKTEWIINFTGEIGGYYRF